MEWDDIWFLYKTPDRTSPTAGAATLRLPLTLGELTGVSPSIITIQLAK